MINIIDKTRADDNLLEKLANFQKQYDIDCLNILYVDNNLAYCIEEIGSSNCGQGCNFVPFSTKNSIVSLAYKAQQPIHHRAGGDDDMAPMKKEIIDEISVPIIFELLSKGVFVMLYIGFKREIDFDIAAFLDVLYDEINLYKVFSYAADEYFRIYKIDKVLKFLMILGESIKTNQIFLKNHSNNVAFWAVEIAKKMNFDKDVLDDIYYAGIFHDMGKIVIKSSILNKEGQLTEEEYAEVKKHAKYGYLYAKELLGDIFPDIPLWVGSHHEKYDGTGYPEGLKGEEIPIQSRILKVADVIDVLYSPRSYKKPVPIHEVIAELKRCKGKDFDPNVVEAALEVIDEKVILPRDILDDDLIPASLSLLTFERAFNFEGYFYRESETTFFKCTDNIGDSPDLLNLLSSSLVIEKLNVLYEYEVDVEKLDENTFLLSSIRPREGQNSVVLLWDLDAHIYDSNGKDMEAKVKKLSADYFVFVCACDFLFDRAKLLKAKLHFDDAEEILLNGRITYYYKSAGGLTYYKFEFVNIRESIRDKIFRQIFRKQSNLRKLLSKF